MELNELNKRFSAFSLVCSAHRYQDSSRCFLNLAVGRDRIPSHARFLHRSCRYFYEQKSDQQFKLLLTANSEDGVCYSTKNGCSDAWPSTGLSISPQSKTIESVCPRASPQLLHKTVLFYLLLTRTCKRQTFWLLLTPAQLVLFLASLIRKLDTKSTSTYFKQEIFSWCW